MGICSPKLPRSSDTSLMLSISKYQHSYIFREFRLDNNIVERALKIPIRVRKNSLIHRTCHGANVAGILMSLIQTCRLAKVNPVDYLTVLQQNKSAVFKQPNQWLPWNYQETKQQVPVASQLMAA